MIPQPIIGSFSLIFQKKFTSNHLIPDRTPFYNSAFSGRQGFLLKFWRLPPIRPEPTRPDSTCNFTLVLIFIFIFINIDVEKKKKKNKAGVGGQQPLIEKYEID
jgi:hypothetical protein